MEKTRRCQQCGKEMIPTSVTFRIPKQKDNKQWEYIIKEFRSGNRFESRWYVR